MFLILGAVSLLPVQFASAATSVPLSEQLDAKATLTIVDFSSFYGSLSISGGVGSAAEKMYDSLQPTPPPPAPKPPMTNPSPGTTVTAVQTRYGANYSCTQTQTSVIPGCSTQASGHLTCIDPVPPTFSFSCNASVDLRNGAVSSQNPPLPVAPVAP